METHNENGIPLEFLEFMRERTGCGMYLISESLRTLIEKLNHKPMNKRDVGHRLKMEWEEYNLRDTK